MSKVMRPAVFLDRDGVVNEARIENGVAKSPRCADEVVICAEALDAVRRLHNAGFLVLVVTNQPDIQRGFMNVNDLEAIHERLATSLGIDAFYSCPHDTAAGCECRKPAPGMILQAARDWNVDLEQSWLIGDRWVDLAAAEAAGVRGVLLESPYSWQPTSSGPPPQHLRSVPACPTLTACVNLLLAEASG